MKKENFLEELEEHLIGISKEDKKEIMQDYEDHFKVGKKEKRTEQEISKSLGNPKQIAREARKELSRETGRDELKSEAIETWVATKKFTKHVFKELKVKTKIFIREEKERKRKGKFSNELWIILGLILLSIVFQCGFLFLLAVLVAIYSAYKYFNKETKDPKNSTKKNASYKSAKKNTFKLIVSLAFNLLLVIWVWISILACLASLFISSIAIIASGALVLAFSVFSLVKYSDSTTRDVLLSALFAGFGITILGGLFVELFEKLTGLFFKLTKKYIDLNMRFIRK